MQTILVIPPSSPDGLVVTLDEAKAQCRVDESDEDALLLRLIAGAQSEIENTLGHALTLQWWRLVLERFPSGSSPILVPRPPLVSLVSLSYADANNVEQTLTDHVLDSSSEPARIHPPETGWPATYSRAHPAVTVYYSCGHTTVRPIDPGIKDIALMLVGRGYENREETITGTIVSDFPHVYRNLLGHPYRDVTDYSGQR